MFLASLWYLLFLFIGLIRADHIMQEAIRAFAKYHPVQCHILLFTYSNEFAEQKMLVDFYRAVVKDNYTPTVLENINTGSKKNDSLSSVKGCNRSLRSFIMGNITHVAKYMIAEKKKEDIRRDLWLLFVKDDSDQEIITSQMEVSIISEVYVARRTTWGYKFLEIYRTAKNHSTHVVYHGDWNIETGFKTTKLTMVERRHDFEGAVFRAAVLDTDNKHVEILRSVWNLLQKELNFTTEFIVVRDNNLDHRVPNNATNILVQMVARNEADVVMVGLMLETASFNFIDYSKTIVQTSFRIYVKRTGVDYNSWKNFFKPLPRNAWFIVVLIVAVFQVLILLMYRICRKAGFTGKMSTLWDLWITGYQMLCLQGGELQQELCSVSLLYLFFTLWAHLVRTMHSAALASTLSIENYDIPFHSLEELLKNEYELGVRQKSQEFDFYYKTDNAFLKKLNKAVMEQNVSNLPSTYLEGLRRVCSEKKYAFMANSAQVFLLQPQIPCKLYYLRHVTYTSSAAYAMAKRNEYLPFIDHLLFKFYEVGLLTKLTADIFWRKRHTLENPQSLKSLEFQDTVGLQLLLLAGIVLSVLILFAELVYSKTRRNRTANEEHKYPFYN